MCNGTDEGIVQYREEPDALAAIFTALTQWSEIQESWLFRDVSVDVDSQPFAVHFVAKPPEQAIGKRKP